ncbi:MAG TPA: hypothetical protein DDZ51_23020 [Planctomycetaceae bacterium]|nr:hypothetical protein [Planctomycetaceae bacterium]
MCVLINHLVGKSLASVIRRDSDSLLTFDDHSTIITYAPWAWVCGEMRMPMHFELEKVFRNGDYPNDTRLLVTGVSFYVESLSLKIYFNGSWALHIQPEDPSPVSWILCLASQKVVSAGGGNLTVFAKHSSP